MGFAKEIEDFLGGYKAVSSSMTDAQDARTRAKAAKRAEDKAVEDDYESLAADPEAYLSPSALAAAKRAPKTPKASSTATPEVSGIMAPYGDNPGEEDTSNGVAMAGGGMVPEIEDEEVPEAIPSKPVYDNPAAAKARAEGKKSYSGSNSQMQSTVAMNGKARNTYADDTGPADPNADHPTWSKGPGLKKVLDDSTKAIQAAMQGFAADRKGRAAVGADPEIDLATGKGAATPAEIKAIDAKIDPDGSMDPFIRGRARLGMAYDYYISRGEPEKAANVTKRILLFDKMASQARGKIAMQLINSGNPDKGAQVLVDAYNENIHDGSTIEVKPTGGGNFSFTVMKDGKVVDQGQGAAADLATMAGGVANGSEFIRRTARVASPTDAPTSPDSAPEDGAPAAPAAPAIPDTAAPAVPAEAPADKPSKPVKRDINWAKKQYVYAASVVKSWEDEVGKNPTPENKARLKDAQIRMAEAEGDAQAIRMATATKNADKGNISIQFDKTLGEWREAAEPLAELPAAPKDGLRGAPPASPAAPAEGAAVTPGSNPATPASANGSASSTYFISRKGGQGNGWVVGNETIPGPTPDQLKPPPPELLAEAKKAITQGASRAGVVKKLLSQGFRPEGI